MTDRCPICRKKDTRRDYGIDFEQQAVALFRHLNTMGENWSAVRVRDGGWEVVQPYSQEAIMQACKTIAAPTLAAQEVDSGMSGDAVERAEWFWVNLPTGRKWTSLATHEKALVCHQIARIAPSLAAQDGLVDELMAQVENCCGPLSTEVCEVAGDDERSILRHNIGAVLASIEVKP